MAEAQGRHPGTPPVPLVDPEEGGGETESEPKTDTPISKAARRIRTENSVLFSPGETEYSKEVCEKVTTFFNKSITKTETNKLERLNDVADLAAIVSERYHDVMAAEDEHAEDVERIEKENKEIEELSQEKGVYDIPEKMSFEKKTRSGLNRLIFMNSALNTEVGSLNRIEC